MMALEYSFVIAGETIEMSRMVCMREEDLRKISLLIYNSNGIKEETVTHAHLSYFRSNCMN